ncbi:MAG: Mth938-like domain-containing protein [Paracoccaceae bacterium]
MNSPASTPEAAFAPLDFDTAPLIDGLGPGFFRLGSQVLRGAVLISPWGARAWGGTSDAATPLTLAGRIDVLILGAGKDIALPPREFCEALESAGIGVDPMSTLSAVRAYNLLLGEGRRVALAALPLPLAP